MFLSPPAMAATLLPKQRLKDYCRRKHYPAPMYTLTEEEKIDLHKHYTIQVTIENLVTAEGRGLSRRIAEFKAAMAAMNLIGHSDPSVFDTYAPQSRFNKAIGRSYSVDHISRAQRTDSLPSMMSLTMAPGNYASAAPSIDGIDSLTENNDSLYGSEITNGKDDYAKSTPTRVQEEEASSESTDEGVEMEASESSATPLAASPVSSPTSRAASVVESDRAKTPTSSQSSQPASTAASSSSSSSPATSSKSKTKSKSNSFLSSFFMLSSLRAISRRSLRRKSAKLSTSDNGSLTKAEFSFEESSTRSTPKNTQTAAPSRPTSATSAVSYTSSTSSSAFSSNSSISSSQQTSASSTSGSFTLPDDGRVEADGPLVNGYSNLITESIIEEEEEEEEDATTVVDAKRKESADSSRSMTLCSSSNGHLANGHASGSLTMPRSSSSSYVLSSLCPHNHFSIYGPVLCSNQHAAKNLTIESTPSAALLRYCVRLYCPLPYYDIRGSTSGSDQKFYVTCRVVLTTSKGVDPDKLPIVLPAELKDYEFTARGSGDTLRNARNMAAQTIIEKLKKSKIYFE